MRVVPESIADLIPLALHQDVSYEVDVLVSRFGNGSWTELDLWFRALSIVCAKQMVDARRLFP